MGTQDNGKIIPLFPPSCAEQAAAQEQETMRDLALLRRRGLDTVELVESKNKVSAGTDLPTASVVSHSRFSQFSSPPPEPALNASKLSDLFIKSLDDMICRVPSRQHDPMAWPGRRDQTLEKAAVDIIDMLFGFVLDDPQVPRGIKESLLRAQMPVLQLAMREPAFFSDWLHPARKLINDIAPMGRRFQERGGDPLQFEREFAAGLERVLDELTPSGVSFASFDEAITAFVNNAPAREGSTESAAWERAEAVARDLLERPLPHLVRDFLAGFWVDVLQRTALLHPEESLQWQDTVAVIEDLTWSLAPKSDQEDRLQLIGLIPALLTRLNRGLDLIDVERSDRRPFFDALIEVHAVVLRAELTPPPPVPKQESTIEKVNRLQRGDWVEFHLADGSSSRERLTWISPQRGLLVFSNHQGQRAIQIAREDLADLVHERKAILIFDQPDVVSDKNSA